VACLAVGAAVVVLAQETPRGAGAGDARSGPRAVEKIHPRLAERLGHEPGPAKTWVFLEDKGNAPGVQLRAAVEGLEAAYNPRAVERRRLRGTIGRRGGALFDELDLPVAQAYVDEIAATGARVHVVSRWLNAVSVWATREQVERIARMPFVDRLQAVGRSRGIRPRNVRESESSARPEKSLRALDYGLAEPQLEQMNLIAVHEAGYTGAGIVIGVLDTGFRRDHKAFTNLPHALEVVAEYDFVDMDSDAGIDPGDPAGQHTHGTLILGCIGAYWPGELIGGAFDASFILCKTEDTTGEYPAEEDNYVAGLEFVEANGGDIATSSLGYIDWYTQAQLDGQTAVTTIAVNAATARGLVCCTAAGNEGHDSNPTTSHLIAPSDALQVIACGAVTASGGIASFSSDGPTADGRVKPELLARGVDTYTISTTSNAGYVTADGTSLSTPLVASAVACVMQAYPYWTVDQLRSALFGAADYFAMHGTHDPQYVRGYGIVNAGALLVGSEDCNQNRIPDQCDLSCGAAGGPCDVPGCGMSADCNNNGVPDECEDDLAPTIVQEPASVQVCLEEAAAFAVGATGFGVLEYQWRKDGQPIDGATDAMYTIASVGDADAGVYDVVVSSPCGSTTSTRAVLTVDADCTPGALVMTSPSNGAEDVPVSTVLKWEAAPRATEYEVHFGGYPPPHVATTDQAQWQPDELDYDGEYFWQIRAVNDAGSTAGPVWTFKTELAPVMPPPEPSGPLPVHGAMGVSVAVTLSWNDAPPRTAYQVHFGTDSSGPLPFVGSTTMSRWTPSGLEEGTVYYWQVVAVNQNLQTPGAVWQFVTAGAGGFPDGPSDPNAPADVPSGSSRPPGVRPPRDDAEGAAGGPGPVGDGAASDSSANQPEEEQSLQATPGNGVCPAVSTTLLAFTLVGLGATRRRAS
jgi:hypothetical protein